VFYVAGYSTLQWTSGGDAKNRVEMFPLKARGVTLAVESILPISTHDYPTKATRLKNSRLDLTRLREVCGLVTPQWDVGLAAELDELAKGA
jgi:dTDP-4-dehydrorhamnose reductase